MSVTVSVSAISVSVVSVSVSVCVSGVDTWDSIVCGGASSSAVMFCGGIDSVLAFGVVLVHVCFTVSGNSGKIATFYSTINHSFQSISNEKRSGYFLFSQKL